MVQLIRGIGTDIVDIARIRKILSGPLMMRFLQRILTDAERVIAEQRKREHHSRFEQYVAGRFAAKEAVAKALGCGFGKQLRFQHIEILHDNHGKPQCTVAEEVKTNLGLKPSTIIHLSISHTAEYASGFAIVDEGTE